MSVFEGLCRSVFCVFCVMMTRSCWVFALCWGEGRLWCCVLVEVLEGSSFLCEGGPRVFWLVFERVEVCADCGVVVCGCGVVSVRMGGCVCVHLRVWRLCGSCWVTLIVGR